MPDTSETSAWVGGPVTLNVGGKFYSTTLETLTRFPDSMLGAMFRGPRPALTDSCGNYFIDRDGKTFRHILNFLRFGRLDLPEGYAELSLLRTEADFYQIRPLLEEVRRLEAERWRLRSTAVLHADVDVRERLLYFNVRRGPQNYELDTCSLQIFTANVFCTDRLFLGMLRRRFGQSDHTHGGLEEAHSGRRVSQSLGETGSQSHLSRSSHSDSVAGESRNGSSWVNAGGDPGAWKTRRDALRICSGTSTDEDEETDEEMLDDSPDSGQGGTKICHHLRLEWAPCPPQLPVAEFAKQKLSLLRVAGREIQSAHEFLEEVLKAALAQGFRIDSVFPDPADILNARSLRFVRH